METPLTRLAGAAVTTEIEGTAMPNAIVMTGYGPPEVLKWAGVPLAGPG